MAMKKRREQMQERDKIQKINSVSIAATTTMGVAGVVTGNPVVQSLAFAPPVIEKVILGLCKKKKITDEKLNKDLEEVIEITCKNVQKRMTDKSQYLAQFFHYASAKIESEYQRGFSVVEMASWIYEDIKIEKKWEGADITENDIVKLVNTFLEIFAEQLGNYLELGQYLQMSAIFNHEKRIKDLEQKTAYENYANTEIKEYDYKEFYSDDNEEYKDKYEEPLFLHKDLPKDKTICLKDVFTVPAAEGYLCRRGRNQKKYEDISVAIKEFIHYHPKKVGDRPVKILFIEGQAAMGKSSLVAWLSWEYYNRTGVSDEIFGKKKLIVIRLRDLLVHGKELNIQAPFEDIYTYLLNQEGYEKCSKKRNIGKKLLKNTVLVLDGFDELCMVEGIVNQGKEVYFYNLYRELNRLDCGCKIIVTTRPSYLNIQGLDFPKDQLVISPFVEDKRQKWVEKYEKKESISNQIKNPLLHACNDKLEALIETPLALYMIVAKKVSVGDSTNMWELYNRIFSEEVYDRNYETEGPHRIQNYKAYLHDLTTEIANAISGEQRFFITVEKLLEKEQVRQLMVNLKGMTKGGDVDYENVQEILADCFGVASYFKISQRQNEMGILKNAIEFYHNNIKDYFCCEYIWRSLQSIYENVPENEIEMEKWFISKFQELFQFTVYMKDDGSNGELSKTVQFFKEKIIYMKEQGIETGFVGQERKNRYFTRFFGKMLQTGVLYKYEYSGNENILNMLTNIYSSVLSIYHAIYLPYLKEGERIAFTPEDYTADISASFIYRILFIAANIHNQSYLRYDGIMLSGIELDRHNFSYSSFRDCLLIRTSFCHCDLRGADFSYASLQYADLRDAIIDENTCFEGAQFKMTKVNKSQLSYIDEQGNDALEIY